MYYYQFIFHKQVFKINYYLYFIIKCIIVIKLINLSKLFVNIYKSLLFIKYIQFIFHKQAFKIKLTNIFNY